ncbi:hypothetical protein LINPERPRIM_LOCUS24949 [Linum perenne]
MSGRSSSASSFDGGGKKSWADIANKGVEPDLQYFPPGLVDEFLQFSKDVFDLGLEWMKKCLVGQYLGSSPPLKGIQSLSNRLWGV